MADTFVVEKSVEVFQSFIDKTGINVSENKIENMNFFFVEGNHNFSDMLQMIQNNSLFMNLFVIYAFFMVFVFFFGIIDRFFIANNTDIEYALLVFFVLLASLFVFYVHSFLDIILALEVITLASYVLVAFERQNRFSTFGGVQYFILGSVPSGMLLLGAGMLYKN
jgi:NADH:ubiquinone oxidoreductase subunit 2 (subunit N)